MENRASERAINMKNFQKMGKNIHEAIYTLRPNLNFNRQTSTIVTRWKEILSEKSHRRHYQIIIIKFKMHILLFAHSVLRNQSIKGSTEVGADMLYRMRDASLSILKKKSG